jgi:lipopolysaccharide export system protein LptA
LSFRRVIANVLLAFAGGILLCGGELRAQGAGAQLPQNVEAMKISEREDGAFVLVGSVTLWNEGMRFQADRIVYHPDETVEAEGNVLIVWGEQRASGERLTYDLKTEHGVLEDAVGQVGEDYLFRAKIVELRGKDRLHLESAEITSCTQPVPYWSFKVARANITVNKYAHMSHVRLLTGKVPVLYIPYMVWPVKRDRAAGLLTPEFSSTSGQGRMIKQDLFIPLGRSADLTLAGQYYTEAGVGFGTTFRAVPNNKGSAKIDAFFIQDKVANASRYRVSYNQTQEFSNGFRMVADMNLLSDFDFSSDYDRDLGRVSSPTILALLDFTRNFSWASLNVREMRRKQLFSGGASLVQETFPEVELRGRPKRVGKSPLYLGFLSSLVSIRQSGIQQNLAIDADYWRADFFPELSMPISRWAWLDINPRISWRGTYWSQYQSITVDPVSSVSTREIRNDNVTRSLFGAGIEITGPKFYKIYNTPKNRFSPKFKHTVEGNVSYGYTEIFDRSADLLLFDEVDRFTGTGPSLNYGLRSRLFAKRRRSKPALGSAAGQIILPNGIAADLSAVAEPESRRPGPKDEGEPVEIATLEIRQRRSFDQPLSVADLDLDGTLEAMSLGSSVDLTGRFNPSDTFSLDLRSSYHVLYHKVSNVSLSGSFHNRRSLLEFSLVHQEGLGTQPRTVVDPVTGMSMTVFIPREDDTQIRFLTGMSLWRNKLRMFFGGSLDANPADGGSRLPNKNWRVEYSTQCCSFMVEKLDRDFINFDQRSNLSFRVDLKGIGKLFDYGI